MNFRLLSNGDMFAPQRGIPPQPPEGYCQDSKNLFLYHPILDECNYRTAFREILGCGKLDIGTHCDLFIKVVTGADCKDCPQEIENAEKTSSKISETSKEEGSIE